MQTNKFALISTVWDAFIENSQNCYVPGQNIIVVEKLFPTKARCRFTQYMPNKPDKFGINFWIACESRDEYICYKWISLFGQGRNKTVENAFE